MSSVGVMNRRDFIILVAGATAATAFPAHAQQRSAPLVVRATPIVGFLNTTSPELVGPLLAAFRNALSSAGYEDGQTVAIHSRWANGQYDRLEALTAELVSLNPAVIAATGGTVAGKAAKAVTSTIPVLFIAGFDPVHEGLVASVNRPGGNATGVAVYTAELGKKRLAMLQELAPDRTIFMLVNPDASSTALEIRDAQDAARRLDARLIILVARSDREIEEAFNQTAGRGGGALLVSADSFFTSRHAQIVALAARHGLPACYPWPNYVEAGGLMSYGENLADFYRRAASFVDKIFKGARPADLPIDQPTRFNLVINRKTADALGVAIPPQLYIFADEVME
jgi:putative ABC transport system substrate-binding protein